MTTTAKRFRVFSYNGKKLVHSIQCVNMMEVATLIAKMEQAGLEAEYCVEWV